MSQRQRTPDNQRRVEVRFTGSEGDVFAALTALGIAHPLGWALELGTTKHRESGQIQVYGRLVKAQQESL